MFDDPKEKAVIDGMAKISVEWSDGELAEIMVILLIDDEGNLNKYELTCLLFIHLLRERQRLINLRDGSIAYKS